METVLLNAHIVTFQWTRFPAKLMEGLGKQMQIEHKKPLKLKSISMDSIFRGLLVICIKVIQSVKDNQTMLKETQFKNSEVIYQLTLKTDI